MASEFMIMLKSSEDTYSATDKIIAVLLAQGEELTVTTDDESFVNGMEQYVNADPAWKNVHSKDPNPLNSMFSRSGYTFAEYFPYNEKNKAKYEQAVKKVGGKTSTFKPKS
jgi:hypothetical protein